MIPTDPRLAVIDRRLDGVRRILAVTGGKGGIGKSVVATTLALTQAESGLRVGLLDLDLTGPCDHLILGTTGDFPTEKFGIVPPEVHGVAFMSVAHFVGEHPAPLRGDDVTNALIELLAITQWGELDLLVIDMPPGLGDTTLDTLRLMKSAEYLIVATASRVVVATVRKTLRVLARPGCRVAGIVENMKRGESQAVIELARETDTRFLGALPFDERLEEALGDVPRLRNTGLAGALKQIEL